MSQQGASKKRPIATYVVLGALLLLTVGVRWWALREPGSTFEEAPQEVQGHWTASDARYAGRGIEVSANTVILHRGEAEPLVGRLSAAREFTADGNRVIHLEYETVEGSNSLEMVTRPDGTMHLRNQPAIAWSVGGSAPAVPQPVIVDAPTPESDGGLPWRFVLAALLGIAVVALAGPRLASGADDGEPQAQGLAPQLVQGVWTTMDQRMAGRTIRIAPGYAFSHFGPDNVRVGGVITDARVTRQDGARVVTLEYARPEGPELLDMAIDRSGHMRLLSGPKSVWVKR